MNKTWRNLLLLVIVLAIAGAYYFFFMPQQKPDFSQDYANLSSAWKSEGFDKETLHSDFDSLMALSESKLSEIKSNLQESIGKLQDDASKELASAYILLVDIAIKTKEIEGLNNGIDSAQPVCNNIAAFKSINSKRAELIELAGSFDSTVNSFAEKFPEQAAEISFNRIGLIPQEMQKNLNEDKENLALLEEGC